MRTVAVAAVFTIFNANAHAASPEWTGGYIGLSLGYADANDAWDQGGAAGDPAISPEGASLGGYVGYTVDLSGLVLGLETDLSFPDLSDNAECTALIECTVDVQVMSSLRVRAGLAMGPVQVYGTGGVALGFIQADSNELGGTSAHKTLGGWTLGGGVEYEIHGNLRFGLEYRHSDYGDTTVALGGAGGDVRLETDEIRLRVAVVFD